MPPTFTKPFYWLCVKLREPEFVLTQVDVMNRSIVVAFFTIANMAATIIVSEARPVYARKERQECGYCHVRPGGGGDRGFRGMFYGGNGLSFQGFDEKREALIAGLTGGATGRNSIPAISYNGNISGPATQQIQLASLRGPVMLVFLTKADDSSKLAVKTMASLAKAYGTQVTVLGVAKTEDALKLTDELGGLLRVYPDADGAAAKKYSAANSLDVAVAAKLGDPLKVYAGFSRSNMAGAMNVLATAGIQPPVVDLAQIPEKVMRGEKLF
jgi:hypothetical protein